MKKVIDQDKNIMAVVIDSNGLIKSYYKDDGNENHHDLFYDVVICKDFNFNKYKKMVYKASKIDRNIFNLVELLTHYGFVVFYDCTNYDNHHKNKDHYGVMALPCDTEYLPVNQYNSFKKLCDELPINTEGISYHEDDELEYEMYKQIRLIRFDKKGYTELGNLGENDYSYNDLFGSPNKGR